MDKGLLALVLIIFTYPYIRFTYKRFLLFIKIKHICKKTNIKLYPTHRLWIFGTNRGKNCDFYIEAQNIVYSVKLFSAKHRRNRLYFMKNNKYWVESFLSFFGNRGATNLRFKSKLKILPSFDYKYKIKEAYYTLTIMPILLISPTAFDVKKEVGKEYLPVNSGDLLYNEHLFTAKGFCNKLKGE